MDASEVNISSTALLQPVSGHVFYVEHSRLNSLHKLYPGASTAYQLKLLIHQIILPTDHIKKSSEIHLLCVEYVELPGYEFNCRYLKVSGGSESFNYKCTPTSNVQHHHHL